MQELMSTPIVRAVLLAVTALPFAKASAQQAPAAEPVAIYRVEYVVREIESGKPTNSRTYKLAVKEGGRGEGGMFRVGSRIPLVTGKGDFQYFDVGMKIDCEVAQEGRVLAVGTRLDMNSVAESEMRAASLNAPRAPVVRNFTLSDKTKVEVGKPALVGSIDDVTANRRYEIEVTVSKAK